MTDAETQLVLKGQWTRLDGTDIEILIPHQGGGGGSASPASGGAIGFGGSNSVSGGGAGGGGGTGPDALVVRVRQAS